MEPTRRPTGAPPQDPPPPRPTLRQRKKAAAMHTIQETALGLFAERGFDAVTVEHIADAAQVSPSTVYRYFGTKEGIVLHDEYDDRLFAAMGRFLAEGMDLWTAAEAALDTIRTEHFEVEAEGTFARVRWWFTTPSVQAAAYLVIDETVERIAQLMVDTGRWTRPQARVLAATLVWPVIATLRSWYEEGGSRPWPEYLLDALEILHPELGDAHHPSA